MPPYQATFESRVNLFFSVICSFFVVNDDIGAAANFFRRHLSIDAGNCLLLSQFVALNKPPNLFGASNVYRPNFVKSMLPARLKQ